MNFWCFYPSVFNLTKVLFEKFLRENYQNIKSEFFIPIIAESFIGSPQNQIKVIPTTSQWFGVTYKEDAPGVKANIDHLISNKTYPDNLWG